MPDLPVHVAFFGDAEHIFALPAPLILELERKTGRGIGGLSRALFGGEYRLADITETIRLGLVGGGCDPEEADALVKTYTAARPVMESYALAVEILNARMLGADNEA